MQDFIIKVIVGTAIVFTMAAVIYAGIPAIKKLPCTQKYERSLGYIPDNDRASNLINRGIAEREYERCVENADW